MFQLAFDILRILPTKRFALVLFVVCFILLPFPYIGRFAMVAKEYVRHNKYSIPLDADGDGVVMGNAFEEIVWMLAVTDIHYNPDPSQGYRYRDFLSRARSHDRPMCIINTGDTTDAILKFPFHRLQMDIEWGQYAEHLNSTGWTDPERYLDAIGNHDAMNSGNPHSPGSLYYDISPTGKYMRTLHHEQPSDKLEIVKQNDVLKLRYPMASGDVSVVVVTTPEVDPGLTIPANFFGNVKNEQKQAVEKAIADADGLVITAAHHCARWTQLQTVETETFADTISKPNVGMHLCGHNHRWGMSRFGEHHTPEIANQRFGHFRHMGLVVDHGLVSARPFTDAGPRFIATNPKPAHMVSAAEPLHRIAQSTHIRVLAMGYSACPTGVAKVDGVAHTLSCTQMPADYQHALPTDAARTFVYLLTAPWDTAQYTAGLHDIEVTVSGDGITDSYGYQFSLDGTAGSLDTVAERSGLFVDSANNYNLFTPWPIFWMAIQVSALASIFLLSTLPLRITAKSAKTGDVARLRFRWSRSKALVAVAVIFIAGPNWIARLNGEDWAVSFNFGVLTRGSFTVDPFMFLGPPIVGLTMFLPVILLFIINSLYKTIIVYRSHVGMVNAVQSAAGLLRVPKSRLRHVFLVVDGSYATLLALVYLFLFGCMAVAYWAVWMMWCPTVLDGIITLGLSPALVPMHFGLLLISFGDVFSAIKVRVFR